MSRRPLDTHTLDLFKVPRPAGCIPASMDYRKSVSEMIGQMLEAADGDRYEIATRCSRLSGKEISKYMLDAYSSGAREDYNAPAWLMPVLEVACETYVYTDWLAHVRGGQLLIGRETLMAELGKFERIKDEAAQKVRELKKQMGENAE